MCMVDTINPPEGSDAAGVGAGLDVNEVHGIEVLLADGGHHLNGLGGVIFQCVGFGFHQQELGVAFG